MALPDLVPARAAAPPHAPGRVGYDLDWEKARLRAEAETNRPLLFGLCLLVLIGTVLLLLTIVGVMPLLLSLVGCLACLAVAFPSCSCSFRAAATWGTLYREREKKTRGTERQTRALGAPGRTAARYTEWQHRKRVYRQPAGMPWKSPPAAGNRRGGRGGMVRAAHHAQAH